MLYVPPGVAHNGVAIGDDCMTYSIGFRAPSRAELLGSYCDDLLMEMSDDDRYTDPNLPLQTNPGEITPAAIAALQAMLLEKLSDRTTFARWFGTSHSTRKYPEIDWSPEDPIRENELQNHLKNGGSLQRNPASRFSFIRENTGTVVLFVDGESYDCAGEIATMAEILCAQTRITLSPKMMKFDAAIELITKLFNQGSLGVWSRHFDGVEHRG